MSGHPCTRFSAAQLEEARRLTGWVDEEPHAACPSCGDAADHDPSECAPAQEAA